jgi:hypothetical protein
MSIHHKTVASTSRQTVISSANSLSKNVYILRHTTQSRSDSMAYLSDVGKYCLVVAVSSLCIGTAVGTPRVSILPLSGEELMLSLNSGDLDVFPSPCLSRFSSSYIRSSELNSRGKLLT